MDQTRLNPEHVRVTPEGARMMTLSRLSEISKRVRSRRDPPAGRTPRPSAIVSAGLPTPESLLFTSDVVPERSSSFIVYSLRRRHTATPQVLSCSAP